MRAQLPAALLRTPLHQPLTQMGSLNHPESIRRTSLLLTHLRDKGEAHRRGKCLRFRRQIGPSPAPAASPTPATPAQLWARPWPGGRRAGDILADTGVSTLGTLHREQPFARKPWTSPALKEPGRALLHAPIFGDERRGRPLPPCFALHPSPRDLFAGSLIPHGPSRPLNRLHSSLD